MLFRSRRSLRGPVSQQKRQQDDRVAGRTLVVDHEGAVNVLERRVGRQDRVVGLDDRGAAAVEVSCSPVLAE